jgi:hypothetical protein
MSTNIVKFQLRRDTSTNWTSSNALLSPGEPGVEINTGKMKIGQGAGPTGWNSLSYISGDGNTGPTGPIGYTGPTGSQGLPGQSSGLVYYFYTEQPIGGYTGNDGTKVQPREGNYGPTGFGMELYPRPGTGNPLYNDDYKGYFAWMNYTSFTGATGNQGLLAEFKYPMTNYSVIPSGTFNFLTNIYSFDSQQDVSIPVNISPVISYIPPSGPAQRIGGGTGPRNYFTVGGNGVSPDDDTPYNYIVPITQSTSVGNTGYLDIQFWINEKSLYSFAGDQRIEFWTEGDSVSQLTTTFAPLQGPTGPIGPTGGDSNITGPTGPTGTLSGTVSGPLEVTGILTSGSYISHSTSQNVFASYSLTEYQTMPRGNFNIIWNSVLNGNLLGNMDTNTGNWTCLIPGVYIITLNMVITSSGQTFSSNISPYIQPVGSDAYNILPNMSFYTNGQQCTSWTSNVNVGSVVYFRHSTNLTNAISILAGSTVTFNRIG